MKMILLCTAAVLIVPGALLFVFALVHSFYGSKPLTRKRRF